MWEGGRREEGGSDVGGMGREDVIWEGERGRDVGVRGREEGMWEGGGERK